MKGELINPFTAETARYVAQIVAARDALERLEARRQQHAAMVIKAFSVQKRINK